MPLVSNSDNADEEANRAVAGGPPNFSDVPFDPHDPEQVKVHYDIAGWSFDHRAELAEVLAEMSVPHTWEGDELVVPEELEEPIDLVFEALEQELGPFPLPLEEGGTEVAYELEEWPVRDVTAIAKRLVDDQVPHRWDEQTLIVGPDDEEAVDAILDEIESDAAAGEGPPPAPMSVVEDLYKTGRRLAKNPLDPKGRKSLFAIVADIEDLGTPDDLNDSEWHPILNTARSLRAEFDADDPDTDQIETLAKDLGEHTHPWV